MRNEFAEWLDGYRWQYWVTGTFRPEMGIDSTDKARKCFDRYLKDVGGKKQTRTVDYFMAVEWNKGKEFTHIHSLINGIRGKDTREMWSRWFNRYGRAVIETYEPGKGANHYLTKYCLKELCDWDIRIVSQSKKQLRLM